MRFKFALIGLLWVSPVWAANVTIVAPDQVTPLGATSGNPLFVTGGGGSGGGSVTQGTSPWVDNITQWASVTLGAPTAYGTTPTGIVPGVNAFVTNFPVTQPVSGALSQTTGATVTTSQPSVTTTAAALTFSGTAHREVQNLGTAAIYIGASGVTTTTGFPVQPGSSYDATRFSGALFAIAAATQTAALISY